MTGTSSPRLGALAVWVIALASSCADRDDARHSSPPNESECAHPFVPSRVGTELEYRWASQQREATVTLSLRSARRQSATWSIRTQQREQVNSVELERACDEHGVEEPWVGIGATGPIAISHQTWRLPRELAPADRFEGTFDASILGLGITLTRTHVVAQREMIDVAGSTYDSLRVRLEDRSVGAAGVSESVAWVAPRVGLVRWEMRGPAGHDTVIELIAARIPGE